ncbi:MAG: TorF family putative porin [Gammaproteobacteria bacterium]|nr:TorF family putative porin [Gammaproteobacteria bacterium]MCY4358872.1 TorF family putative porin [Gammaproteobacteria bacterium]
MKNRFYPLVTVALLLFASAVQAQQWTANFSATNNYIWRGLTQSINEGAIQGGIDYAADSGFYVGTWASNVSYESDDVYSYEHDIYFGYAGEEGGISYDIGYLYYNYDSGAGFDFGEVYGAIGVGNFSAQVSLLTYAEPDEEPGQDFGFAQASYWSFDYVIPLDSGAEIGLHAGFHEGDFMYAFNGATDDYWDFNISIAKDGFSAMVTTTTLGDDDDGDGFEDFASMGARDNDEMKFVVGYSMDFEL